MILETSPPITPAKPLIELAQDCPILPLVLDWQLQTEANWQGFAGNRLHGWLGHGLRDASPQAYHALFHNQGPQAPAPYWLRLPSHQKNQWQAGELYRFELWLFGDAVQLAPQVLAACQAMSQRPLNGARLRWIQASVKQPDQRLSTQLEPMPLSHWLAPPKHLNPLASANVRLQLHTPLRLKRQKQFWQSAPPLDEWLIAVKRRWQLLAEHWVDEDQDRYRALHQALPRLGSVTHSDHTQRYTLTRYSLKQENTADIGGLIGYADYSGELLSAWPWLQIGEVLGVGSKTAFGLGEHQWVWAD